MGEPESNAPRYAPRAYQVAAIDAARSRFAAGDRATVVVLPTGAGKTVVFSEIARRAAERGHRVLVLAHRAELLEQARAKIQAVAPSLRVDLERAEHRATDAAHVVVASVPTLRGARLERWPRDAFRLIVVDEAHHATAASYRRILEHFAGARVLGFTATPDRADGESLREVFPSVAFSMSMLDLIRAGYLAPLTARTVRVDAFDLSGAQVIGGDVGEGDVARALGRPGVLDAIAELLVQHTGERSTIAFVAGVDRAHELARLLEARGCTAVAVDGTTAPDARRAAFDAFSAGHVRFLVNVGVATEGTDVPRCSCVAVVRPTMSRGLFVQMVGRGVRPFGAWDDEPASPEARKLAIAASSKPDCLLLNFAPSNARHRLVAPADALIEPGAAPDVRAYATGDGDLVAVLEQATERAAKWRRDRAIWTYRAEVRAWDPFSVLGPDMDFAGALDADAEGAAPEPNASRRLVALGVPPEAVAGMSPGLASVVLRRLVERRDRGLCSFRIARQLARRGLNPDVSAELGAEAMQALAAAHWRGVPSSLRNDPRFKRDDDVAADRLLSVLRGAA